MPRLIRRLLLLSVVCAGGAFGQSVQGSFAQIAFGGSWQTTFTLINMDSTSPAGGSLSFFGDDGSPLNVPVNVPGQSVVSTSSYTFTIPAGGAVNIVLPSTVPNTTQGWASMTVNAGNSVRGQGSFRFLLPGGQISEAVVPLANQASSNCLILCISPSNILMPFDNTANQYITSIALANTASTTQAVAIEFRDQSYNLLVADTLNLTALQHKAFRLIDLYPQTTGMKGILRIHDNTTDSAGGSPFNAPSIPIIALGLLSNVTNAVTTIIPITQ